MIFAVAACFIAAALVGFSGTLSDRAKSVLAPIPAILIFGLVVKLSLPVWSGDVLLERYAWAAEIGAELTFRFDGLACLFALLITGIGALILLYATGYMRGKPMSHRLWAYLYLFEGSMLGLVLADNVFALFAFWELTSISSFLLIGFEGHKPESRRAAMQALIVTGGGGLALLAGLLMLGGGSASDVSLAAPESTAAIVAVALVLLACFTKSAQVPFHFWLPGAMAAPTPVSAYLHSATMVKAGLYLLLRLSPGLSDSPIWTPALVLFGGVTAVFGAVSALGKRDWKQVLAYSTVSALGLIAMSTGIPNDIAIMGGVAFLVAHACYKGALFMIAGAVDLRTGTRDLNALGGLGRHMPILAISAALACLSFAGIVFTAGFIGKELILEGLDESGGMMYVTVAALVTASFFVAIALLLPLQTFLGKVRTEPRFSGNGTPLLWIGPAVLALLGLALALLPDFWNKVFLAPTANSLGLHSEKLAHFGFKLNWLLGASAITWVLGFALYRLRGVFSRLESAVRLKATDGYERLGAGVKAVATSATNAVQVGYLRRYVLVAIGTFIVLVVTGALAERAVWPGALELPAWHWDDFAIHEALIFVAVVVAALVGVRSKGRLSAIASLGVVGFGISCIYVLYGAPDLALTQFLVETLTVILFVLVFYHLPKFSRLSSQRSRFLDFAVAIGAGAIMTTMVLLANSGLHEPISTWHTQNAYEAGKGRNIVNVILVDFRGLDTLGEITVLVVAALGVFALLKLIPKKEATPSTP